MTNDDMALAMQKIIRTFPVRLRTLIDTDSEAAERLNKYLGRESIDCWLNIATVSRAVELYVIAEILGVSMEYLLTGEENKS